MGVAFIEHLTQVIVPIPSPVAIQGVSATNAYTIEIWVGLQKSAYLEERRLEPIFVFVKVRFVERRYRDNLNTSRLNKLNTGLDELIPRFSIAPIVLIACRAIRLCVLSADK